MFQDFPPLLPTPQRSSHRRTHKVLPRPLQPWPTPVRGYHSRLKHFRKPTPTSASKIQDLQRRRPFCPTQLMLSAPFAGQRFRFALRASRSGIILGARGSTVKALKSVKNRRSVRNLFRRLRDEKGRALALARSFDKRFVDNIYRGRVKRGRRVDIGSLKGQGTAPGECYSGTHSLSCIIVIARLPQ